MKYLLVFLLAIFALAPRKTLAQSADAPSVATRQEMKRVRIPLGLALSMGWNAHYRLLFLDKWQRHNTRGTFRMFIDPPGDVYFKTRHVWMKYYKTHPAQIAKDFL